MQIDKKSAVITALIWGLFVAGCSKSNTGASQAPAPAASPQTQQAPQAVTAPAALSGNAAPATQPQGGHSPSPVAEAPHQGKLKVDPRQKFTHYRVGDMNVKAIYADGKTMWIGTSGGGVIRYDTRDDSFKVFDNSNGLLSNGAFYVGKIKGHIAVGTYGGGMSLLQADGVTWKNYNIPQGVGDPFVYGAIEARNGDIWIATWSGLNRVHGGDLDNPEKWDLFTVENTHGGLPNDWVYGLAEGKNGEIWLATEGGVARLANGKWSHWNHENGVGAPYDKVKSAIAFKNDPGRFSEHHAQQKKEMGLGGVDVAYNPNYIIALTVGNDGQVWAGTWGGGLSRFDGKQWKTYTTAEGLPDDHVFMLHKDADGQIWIGTGKGLALWQDGKFKVLTSADGLLADNVFAMETTPGGGKWIGSYGGVAYLRPAN
ncbi:MAG: two-component regulator propeller domain-containing protein [Gallionellaceae bacterium]